MTAKRSFLERTGAEVLASAKTILLECTAHSVEWKTDSKFRK
jgi:hypothetical protein